MTRVRLAGVLDELQAVIRKELGADRILLNGSSATEGADTQRRADPEP